MSHAKADDTSTAATFGDFGAAHDGNILSTAELEM
jgi:hypothetical protein